ncbi:MAG: hypothetical protein ABMA64_08130 [Myxococcota bacterium]
MWWMVGCGEPTEPTEQTEPTEPTDGETSDTGASGSGCAGPLTGWSEVDLPGARESMAVATDGVRAYSLGGWTPTGATTEVWAIDGVADGAPSFVVAPSLPGRREHGMGAVAAGRLWHLGGDDGQVFTSTVWSAPLDAGVVGAWVEAEPLPTPLGFAAAAVWGDHLFVVGGLGSWYDGPVDAVVRFDPRPDGTYTLTPQPPLPEPRFGAGITVDGDTVWVVGGASSFFGDAAGVWRAEIGADGALGEWQDAGELPEPLVTPAATVVDGRLVVAGGLTGWSEGRQKVWGATDDGFERLDPLPSARIGHGNLRVGDGWLLLGGWTDWQSGPMYTTAVIAGVCR